MKRELFLLLITSLTISFHALYGQNKDTALISITNFRLESGTYSWRGTNTFYDMTAWDSSPYTEGHLTQKSGANWAFRMNYRLLFPTGYDPEYGKGYPLIIVLHGAGERGNCWDSNCYCNGCNSNSTPDPAAAPEFLNNDHVLFHGGQTHLNAVNRAGGKKPDDETLGARDFPGFVLFPQNENAWGNSESGNSAISYALRILRLVIKQYNVDPDRVYIHGLSFGGQGVYKALNMADWLFAAGATMSAIHTDALEYDSVAAIPLWIFQGGKDTNPKPFQTESIVKRFREAGGSARYTLYPHLGHSTWNTAYNEPDFFSWFLSKRKSDIHVYYDAPAVCRTTEAGAKLGLSAGFPAYQWERDGQIIQGANSAMYEATVPGVYRARFSRISATPSEEQWNAWSAPVTIYEQDLQRPAITQQGTTFLRDLNDSSNAILKAPEGYAHYYWYRNGELTTLPDSSLVRVKPGDCGSPCTNQGQYTLSVAGFDKCPSTKSADKSLFFENQAPTDNAIKPDSLTAKIVSPSSVFLMWNDKSQAEKGYEVWRKNMTQPDAKWEMVLTDENATFLHDTGLMPESQYYYKIRAFSKSARSDYYPGADKTAVSDNLVITLPSDDTAPLPPQNLAASLTGVGAISLTWNAGTDQSGIKEYVINFGTQTIRTQSTATTYTVTGLPVNTVYNVTVSAVDVANNQSPPSNQIITNTYTSGLFYKHSTGAWTDLDDPSIIATWKSPEYTGVVPNFSLTPRVQEDYFNFEFEGYLYISTAGNYTFYLNSDDGSRLFLDNAQRIDFDGRHGFCASGTDCPNGWGRPSGSVYLTAGPHLIKVQMFDYTGAQNIRVSYNGADTGGSTIVIPSAALKSGNYVAPTPPAVPSGVTAVAAGMTAINLNWQFSGTGSAFEIYRSIAADGPFVIVNRVSALTYKDENLIPGTVYHYKLKTVNGSGASGFSAVAKAQTLSDTEAPTRPTGLVLTSGNGIKVSLLWNASTDNVGVAGYEIWANGEMIGTSALPAFVADSLEMGKIYSFTVVAYDADGNRSAESSPVTNESIVGAETPYDGAFSLYPNPTTWDNIKILFDSKTAHPIEIEVTDIMSKSMFRGVFEAERLREGILLPIQETLANGIYVITLHQQRQMVRQKVLIKN